MNPFKFFALIGIFVFTAFTSAQAQDSKATIRAAYDDLNKRDYAAFTKLVTPDFMEYAAGPMPVKTPQAAIEAYKMFFTAFPDLKFEIEDITAGTDGRYYLKTKITGTNTGAFGMLPPTGKKISLSDVDIIQLNAKGLATSHWSANPNGILSAVGYGSVTNPSTATIMDVYSKFSKGDVPGILAMCTDDVVFEVHDNVLNPTPKTYKGKAGVKDFFTDLASKDQYTVFQPWRFIADGDDVIILVHAEFKHMPDGKMYKTNYVHHFTVVNGKITSFKGVADIEQPEMMATR
jgi:ketosteroid isomerase-like protein